MNILFSTIGRRGYLVDYFRQVVPENSTLIGTSDRHSTDDEYTVGFYHCDKFFIVPSMVNEIDYVSHLINLCASEDVNLLISLYDIDNYILSKHKNKFISKGIIPLVSDFDINGIAFDKFKTYNFLKNNGFKTPLTQLTESIDWNLITYPSIVKPRFGFGSDSIYLAYSKSDIIFFKSYCKSEMIVQELLKGEEYSFDILNDLNGKPITAAVKKKLKMRSGETDQGISVKNSTFLDTAYRLADKLKHIGPLDVDFFDLNGQPYILELNPRFGGGYPITHNAGLNFPDLIVKMIQNNLDNDYSNYRNYEENILSMKDIKIVRDEI